jgi:spore germination cell wall hydrolase CwlJ-like protein
MFKFNTQKFNTLTVILSVLTLIYTAPTLSREFIETATEKQVSLDYQKQVDCLAKNIYYEAASETYEGKLAVAQVTLNRVNSGIFPKDICSVVYQKTTDQNLKTVCQFSWTCMAKELLQIRDRYKWEESVFIAQRALTVPFLHDKIAESNALYYHAVYVKPGWNNHKVVAKIGNHIFYTRT